MPLTPTGTSSAIMRPSATLRRLKGFHRYLPSVHTQNSRKCFSTKRLSGNFYTPEKLRGMDLKDRWFVVIKMQPVCPLTHLHYQGCQNMLSSVFDSLFGCSHRRTTFPLTPKRPSEHLGAYVTCLDCGKEFAYNWDEMRMEVEEPLGAVAATPPGPITRPAQGLSRLLRLGS